MLSVNENPNNLTKMLEEHFGPGWLPQMEKFSNALVEDDSDIMILLARKAICMLDIFEAMGWKIPNKIMISDRALDESLADEIKGKSITVVDDIVMLGSTISMLKKKLDGFGAADIRSKVFSVNTDWHSPVLYRLEGSEMLFSNSQAAIFCNKVVEAISMCGKPYAVDFPLFEYEPSLGEKASPIDIFSENSGNFSIIETTSRFNARFSQRRYVLHLDNEYIHNLIGDILPESSPAISKIRVYYNPFIQRYGLVPFITFDELSTKEVRDIIIRKILCPFNGKYDYFISLVNKISNKQINRVYHYLISVFFFNNFLYDNDNFEQNYFTCDLSQKIDLRRLMLSFGPLLGSQIINLIADLHQFKALKPSLRSRIRAKKIYSPIAQNIISKVDDCKFPFSALLPSDVSGALSQCFTALYLNIELPARYREKKKLENNSTYGRTDDDVWSRLEMGLTFNDLLLYASSKNKSFKDNSVREKMSTFLDLYIDRGVIVPCTASHPQTPDITYRVYRHGEDVLFAYGHYKSIADSLLYAQKSLRELEGYGAAKISSIKIEKLLVLLLKLMYAKQIATPMTEIPAIYEEEENRILSVEYERMGAVLKGKRSSSRGDYKSVWLRDALMGTGIIIDNEIQENNLLANTSTTIDPDDQYLLNKFAQSYVFALKDEDNVRFPIVLASCSNQLDALTAILADIDICFNDYNSQAKTFLAELIQSFNVSFTTINSACDLKALYTQMNYNEKSGFVSAFKTMFSGNAKNAIENCKLKSDAFPRDGFERYYSEVTNKLENISDMRQTDRDDLVKVWKTSWEKIRAEGYGGGYNSRDINDLYETQIKPRAEQIDLLFSLILELCSYVNYRSAPPPTENFISLISSAKEKLKAPTATAQIIFSKLEYITSSALTFKENLDCSIDILLELHTVFLHLKTDWISVANFYNELIKEERASVYCVAGKLEKMKYLLWYDIIDSRQKRSDSSSMKKTQQNQFKASVNYRLSDIFVTDFPRTPDAHTNKNLWPFAVSDSSISQDDEKFIYAKTPKQISKIATSILGLAKDCNIALRMGLIDCDLLSEPYVIYKTGNPNIAHGNGVFFAWFASIREAIREQYEIYAQKSQNVYAQSYLYTNNADSFFNHLKIKEQNRIKQELKVSLLNEIKLLNIYLSTHIESILEDQSQLSFDWQ